jgi:hypothetical protein
MMQNEVLFGMSDNDLRQRYKGTYISYGGIVSYVRDFMDGLIYYKTANGDDKSAKFDWKLVDTSRPRGKWYTPRNALKYAAYLSYPLRKQFHRGLCGENTVIFFPDQTTTGFNLWSNFLCYGSDPIQNTPIAITKGGIFKDHILLTPPHEDKVKLFMRQQFIGHADLDKQELSLYYPRFQQEIYEACELLKAYKFTSLWGQAKKPSVKRNPFFKPVGLDEVLAGFRDDVAVRLAPEVLPYEAQHLLALEALERWNVCLELRE